METLSVIAGIWILLALCAVLFIRGATHVTARRSRKVLVQADRARTHDA